MSPEELLGVLPDRMRAQLQAGDREAFDREMQLAELFQPELRERIERLAASLSPDATRYDLFKGRAGR